MTMKNELFINFETDNAAFNDDNGPAEIARILRMVADLVLAGHGGSVIHDYNGNTIGVWGYSLPGV